MTTIGHPYTLPTTANVSFQEFLAPNTPHQRHVSDVTAFRGRLRTALKEHKHSSRHDFLNVQKAIEDYIPHILGLVSALEATELRAINEIETTWRCTLSSPVHLSTKQPRVKHKSVYYEYVFTLLTLGYVYMDRANEYSQSAHNKILVAIGDVSTYTGGYGDGSSMAGPSINYNAGSAISAGVASGMAGSSSSTSSTSKSSSSSTASRLFKKKSSIMKGSASSNTIGEFTDYLTEEDLAGIDHQLTTAADLYCKAAGIFEYVAQDLIPKWSESGLGASGGSGKGTDAAHPVDVQTSVVSAHIKLALGEAHACTVRKASIKAARASALKAAESSSSAGAGAGAGASASAGASKTSYVLLAKLSIGVKEEYERAYGLLKSVKDLNEISSDFRAHVKDAKVYYEALALTLLGMDAYESQQYGKAIGLMTSAKTSFSALVKSSKAATIVSAASFEYRLANEKCQAFQKINDSVTFEKVPSTAELLTVMPSGRDLLKPKKYQVPRPCFGPLLVDGNGGTGGDDSVNKLAYALQGAYF
ncbi:hypothetical protein CPC16_008396 [Podila verticillata]|nr:hypothetical protein BGZ52_001395 [Haplosporangium bisporale]KAF9211748.1 hypothetical protein BGZ59_007665 [Podila verticillata]KAF9395406.1 hypothetical protein CPC16_008396 [Podila verticillata]KAI9237572.1 MAG: BRO1-like domain-containing protein [Podila humilis]KFH71768.1 hypothetical protein MVEG_02063 [Podila verticillata NRRL 6337]